jgi:predicted DNA binding CopG/RHH family protein
MYIRRAWSSATRRAALSASRGAMLRCPPGDAPSESTRGGQFAGALYRPYIQLLPPISKDDSPIDEFSFSLSPEEAADALASLVRKDREEVEPSARLTIDPDEFIEQDERREKALRMQDAVRRGRSTSIALRLDRFTLKRLRALAILRGIRYQTLLKQFVVERLYEEEKRAGIIDP